MTKRRSGAQQAEDYVENFQAYLGGLKERGDPLPLRGNGELNLSKIAADSGIRDRGRFYTNTKLKALLEHARSTQPAPVTSATVGVPHVVASEADSDTLRRVERRAQRLEQQNAALVAENAELRRQLRELRLQLGREDMVIETGRRLPAPPEQ